MLMLIVCEGVASSSSGGGTGRDAVRAMSYGVPAFPPSHTVDPLLRMFPPGSREAWVTILAHSTATIISMQRYCFQAACPPHTFIHPDDLVIACQHSRALLSVIVIHAGITAGMDGAFSRICLSFCLFVCPRSNRKTAWAINAKHCTRVHYSSCLSCIDPEVKRSKVKVNGTKTVTAHGC